MRNVSWLLYFVLDVVAVNCLVPASFTNVASVRSTFYGPNNAHFPRRSVLVNVFTKTEVKSKQDVDPRHDRPRRRNLAMDNTSTASDEIILTMFNGRYNLTSWADHHPGGIAVLRKYNHRNATQAYEKIGHSHQALTLLETFRIVDGSNTNDNLKNVVTPTSDPSQVRTPASTLSKLITKEDPFNVHKVLGIFCLLHFLYRYALVFTGRDITAGFGSFGKATAQAKPRVLRTMAFLLPHALLSSSSLLFHTVPLERVRGKPMIWKEYRWHNMVFAFRSIVACSLAALMIKMQDVITKRTRVAIVAASGITCLATHALADVATAKLRTNLTETTVTTVPFWEGCSPAMHIGLRTYYGYSQFAATLSCLTVCRYPSWSYFVLFPIQLASLLMTLCRKGIITSRQFHFGYTISLMMTLFAVLQNALLDPKAVSDLTIVVGGATVLYALRRTIRMNKYALWIPVVVGRVAVATYQ